MNTVIIVVGIVLLVLAVKFIVLPFIGLLFKLLMQILKYLFKLLVLIFKFLLYLFKWTLISVPVIIIISSKYPNLVDERICLIVILSLSILDIVVLRRIVNNYWLSHDGQSHYLTEEYSSLYVLNKRSKIAHWFLDPSAFTISVKNRKYVEATVSELEKMGYRMKKNN